MKIRILCLVTTAFVFTTASVAQDVKKVSSTVTHAAMYLSGAELTHTATATLPRGMSELTIEGLSGTPKSHTIKISTTGNVVVTSQQIRYPILDELPVPATLKRIQDSIALCNAAVEKIASDLKINETASILLQRGIDKNVAGSEKGLGVDELVKMMDYHKAKSEALYAQRTTLIQERTRYQGLIKKLSDRVYGEMQRTAYDQPRNSLVLTVSSPVAQSCKFTITYMAYAGSWRPCYEISVADIGAPVKIAAKALIQQNTGLNWDNVRLSLKTSWADQTYDLPKSRPWFLRDNNYTTKKYMAGATTTVVRDEGEVSIDSRPVQGPDALKVRGTSTILGYLEPLYMVDGQQRSQAEFQAIDPTNIKSITVLKDASATSIYGERGANGVIVVEIKKGMDDFVNEAQNAAWATYEIDIPYSIGNRKQQTIALTNKETAAEYKYVCYPRIAPTAYLTAEISDWAKLGLLSGFANVIFGGTYMGYSKIDASTTGEKLILPLGTEERIAVKRETVQDFSSTKSFGSDVLQVFTYQTTIKNNLNRAIKIDVWEQYPVSTLKSVEVTLITKDTTPGANGQTAMGMIGWTDELAAGQSKTYRISYSVKYPQGMSLNLQMQ